MSFEEILFSLFICMSIIPTYTPSPLSNYNNYSAVKTNVVSTNRDQLKPPTYLKVPTFIQTFEGANVILSCSIENLTNNMVFWIRNSDLQILTAGLITFSSDSRFKVNHENSVDERDWSLLITNVKIQDSGIYECQINTDPKMKLNINLLVKESEEMMEMDSPFVNNHGASVSIEGDHVRKWKEGQTVTFKCVIIGTIDRNDVQKNIEWLKNGEPLSLKTRSGGSTFIDTVWNEHKEGISRLTLAMLKKDDEGKYSCSSNDYISEAIQFRVTFTDVQEDDEYLEVNSMANSSWFNCNYVLIYLILTLNFYSF